MQSIPIAIFGFSMVLTALLPWPEGLHVYSIPYGRNIMMVFGIAVEVLAVWCGAMEGGGQK